MSAGVRRQGKAGQSRRYGALARFQLLRMDGDETTHDIGGAAVRQNAGLAGISSSCHALCTGPWWCCGSRAERCHRAIEIGLLRSGAGAEIALRRRARHTSCTCMIHPMMPLMVMPAMGQSVAGGHSKYMHRMAHASVPRTTST